MKKRFLAVLFAAVLLVAAVIPAGAASVSDFKDVKTGSWYYKAVDFAVSNGLFSGTSNDTFSPDTPMTRGMFVAVLGRKAMVDKSQYRVCRFKDVKANDYFAPYAEWAATFGIVSGISATEFAPNQNITREQMASILYRYAKATENDVAFTSDTYKKFSDTSKVSSWAKESFQWASSKKIINGVNGKLDPSGTATRAQVAQVFLGAKDVLVKTEISSKPSPAPTKKPTPTPTAKPTPAPTAKPTPVPTQKPNIDATVYWVSGGSVYHSTDRCPALSRSTNIKSGTVEQAIAAGKKRPCKDCH